MERHYDNQGVIMNHSIENYVHHTLQMWGDEATTPENFLRSVLGEKRGRIIDVNAANNRLLIDKITQFIAEFEQKLGMGHVEPLSRIREVLIKMPQEFRNRVGLAPIIAKIDVTVTKIEALTKEVRELNLVPNALMDLICDYDNKLGPGLTKTKELNMTLREVEELGKEYSRPDSLNPFENKPWWHNFFKCASEEQLHIFFHGFAEEFIRVSQTCPITHHREIYLRVLLFIDLLPPDLKTLNLTDCKLTVWGRIIRHIAKRCPRLKVLNLSFCKLNIGGIFALKGGPWHDLEQLDIRGPKKLVVTGLFREIAANMPKLKRLDLRDSFEFSEQTLELISGSHSLKGVEILVKPGDAYQEEKN